MKIESYKTAMKISRDLVDYKKSINHVTKRDMLCLINFLVLHCDTYTSLSKLNKKRFYLIKSLNKRIRELEEKCENG